MRSRYEMTAATHTGRVRDANEDSLRIMPECNLAVVADGMGGHAAGEVASRMAVDALCDFYEAQRPATQPPATKPTGDSLAEAFRHANRQVFAASRQLENYHGMGTTLLAASFDGDEVRVGHIGDCRMYRFVGKKTSSKVKQLTTDHSLAAALRAAGPDTRIPAHSHHILQKALGLEARCQPDFFTANTAAGEIYLLCSDGLCGVIDDDQIVGIMSRTSHQIEACADALVNACLERGAPDNISVILVRVQG